LQIRVALNLGEQVAIYKRLHLLETFRTKRGSLIFKSNRVPDVDDAGHQPVAVSMERLVGDLGLLRDEVIS